MCSSEVNSTQTYIMDEPGFYIGEIAVCNPVELAILKIEFLERFGRLPDIRRKKEKPEW